MWRLRPLLRLNSGAAGELQDMSQFVCMRQQGKGRQTQPGRQEQFTDVNSTHWVKEYEQSFSDVLSMFTDEVFTIVSPSATDVNGTSCHSKLKLKVFYEG